MEFVYITCKTRQFFADTGIRSIHRFLGSKGTCILPARETNGEIIIQAEKLRRRSTCERIRLAGWSAQLNAAIFLLIPTNSSDNPLADPYCGAYLSSPSFTIAPHRAAAIRQRPLRDHSNAPRLFRQATATMSRRYVCVEGRLSKDTSRVQLRKSDPVN